MSRISRRHFLQFAGSTCATLGLSQLSLPQQAERYGKVLAQSTPRKVALLVGINNYPDLPLRGCLTDVELQRHLLIHRFGFNPKDIYTLTDAQATRDGILAAFEEYLIKQAKPRDVVVYHYSGHGSRVLDPDPIVVELDDQNTGLNGTFVPIDADLSSEQVKQGTVAKDIMGHTLFLLMSAVKSENFTAVLDSCYSGGAVRERTIRARDGGQKVQISPAEKAYQEQWLSRLKLSRAEFVRRYREGVAKGVVLAATDPYQTAIDATIERGKLYAGAFTYLLTQYLWENDSTPEDAIASIIPEIPEDYNQTPGCKAKFGSGYEKQPIYFTKTPRPIANAVITAVDVNSATLWLGGVELETVGNGTVFAVMNSTAKVTLRSRNGLVGTGTATGSVKPGALLQQLN